MQFQKPFFSFKSFAWPELLIFLFYFILFSWLILKKKNPILPATYYYVLFIIKVITGFAMIYIYTYIYPVRLDADIFRYFDDSKVLYRLVYTHPVHFLRIFFGINPDSPELYGYYNQMICWDAFHTNMVIRVNVLLRFISGGFYSVHMLVISFLSTSFLVLWYQLISKALKTERKIYFFFMVCFPGILFWTSGMLKESIAFCLIISILALIFILLENPKANSRLIILAALLIILLGLTKLYLMVSFVVALFLALILKSSEPRKNIMLLCIFFIVLILLIFNNTIPKQIAYQQAEFYELAEKTGAGSLHNTFVLQPTWFSILFHIPQAFWNVISKPWIFDGGNALFLISGLENEFIIGLILLTVFTFSNPVKQHWLIIFCFFFVLMVFVQIGLTTPVIGAALRYRSVALPFLGPACLALIDKKKLRDLIGFLIPEPKK